MSHYCTCAHGVDWHSLPQAGSCRFEGCPCKEFRADHRRGARTPEACRRNVPWTMGKQGDMVLKGIRNTQMHAAWLVGETCAVLARRYGISQTRVEQLVKRENRRAAGCERGRSIVRGF